jgi:tetratricopeptide (TPR) repeat protein
VLGVLVDWPILDVLLQCQPGHERLHLITLVLSGLASVAAVIAAAYRLWRWWVGPLRTHRVAARALRMEGTYHAKLNHGSRAMQLYSYSIRLNPRAAHVYYLRGTLHEEMGNIDRAVADWRRCLARLPGHKDAAYELARHHAQLPSSFPWATAASTFAAVLVLGMVGWLGLTISQRQMDGRSSIEAVLSQLSGRPAP